MAGLVIDDGVKESDYGYVLRVSGPRESWVGWFDLLCTRQGEVGWNTLAGTSY